MTSPLRRRLRLARRGAWYAVAIVLVAMALAAGALSRLLPLVERHPDRVAAWLSERTGRPVAFDRLGTGWTRRGPLLRFDGLRLGEGDDAVRIGEAEMLVSQYAGLLPGRSFTELRLRGLQLTLERESDGRWQVRGLPGEEQASGDPFAALERLGELQVVGGRLTVVAPAFGIEATLPKIDLRLRVDGERLRSAARVWIDEAVPPLDLAVDLHRQRGDGQAYAAVTRADLGAWSPLLRAHGIAAEAGGGRARLWLQLRQNRVTRVTVDAALADVALRGAPLSEGLEPPRMRFGQLEAKARWQLDAEGWRFDAPRLRIGGDGAPQVLDGLAAAGGGGRFALRAGHIDAGPLLAALALADRFDPGLRRWLLGAAPDASIHDIAVTADARGRVRTQARMADLRFAAFGDTPGVSGLAGTLSGDEHGFRFEPDPQSVVRFDWPPGFGAPHPVTLRGDVVGWREGAGMRIGTPALRIEGEGYAADARGGMWFQNDGTRPFIDLAVRLDEAHVPVAKRFWVRHLMADAAERWLDAALVDGRVRDGRALVVGDLDDWPFSSRHQRQHHGLFHAQATLAGMVVKFQPDWPALEHFDGEAAFVNDGFTVSGQGSVGGVEVRDVHAALAHYGGADLEIGARSSGNAARLLALLRQSPLRQGIEDTLDALSADGPSATTFAMRLPLGSGARPRLSGTVELEGVALADARWQLAFEQVRGRARYDQHGFDGNDLSAVRDGRRGTLSLRAGQGHVRDAAAGFEAELDATLGTDDLLRQAPQLDWLAPHISGRSRWQMGLAIPRAGQGGAPARLQLASDLVGTALDLPEPLAKPAGEALQATIATTLPMGEGEVRVDLGGRLALRARNTASGTGVRVELGASQVLEPPPASGLVATGHAPVLDALGWSALASGGSGEGLPLRGIDVSASRLAMLGTGFADTRLRVSPVAVGTRVEFEGAALSGTLQVPHDARAPITGGFSRLHWPAAVATTGPAPPGDASAGAPPRAPDAGRDDVDPARVPPLQIDVEDFRFGALALGRLELRTRPTVDGLAIERLQARSRTQRIEASGAWNGRGDAARTSLQVDADSEDFGELMSGLGFGHSIDGGRGRLRFNADWARGPGDFALGAMQGGLSLQIEDGRLVEVEPGAGRVLGLLSVAQLPRRLMLDFRDFFAKGFAFNRIAGSVHFAAGTARSDDMVIEGPAAEIRMRGRSDLRAQTHDQTIEVLPRTGNLLPAVGAIAGGPMGAAVGAVANAMLRRPLGEMGARTYRVTGPWKDPKVDVVEPGAPPQAAVAPPSTRAQ